MCDLEIVVLSEKLNFYETMNFISVNNNHTKSNVLKKRVDWLMIFFNWLIIFILFDFHFDKYKWWWILCDECHHHDECLSEMGTMTTEVKDINDDEQCHTSYWSSRCHQSHWPFIRWIDCCDQSINQSWQHLWFCHFWMMFETFFFLMNIWDPWCLFIIFWTDWTTNDNLLSFHYGDDSWMIFVTITHVSWYQSWWDELNDVFCSHWEDNHFHHHLIERTTIILNWMLKMWWSMTLSFHFCSWLIFLF